MRTARSLPYGCGGGGVCPESLSSGVSFQGRVSVQGALCQGDPPVNGITDVKTLIMHVNIIGLQAVAVLEQVRIQNLVKGGPAS